MVRKFAVKVNGKEYIVEVEEMGGSTIQMQQTQSNPQVIQQTPVVPISVPSPVTKQEPVQQVKQESVRPAEQSSSNSAGAKIVAPMSGVILKVLVSTGQKVEYGQKLLILEAMKMENDIVADKSGIVKNIKVKEGESVDTGDVLVELE